MGAKNSVPQNNMNFRQGPSTTNQNNMQSTLQKVSLEEAYESLEDYKEAINNVYCLNKLLTDYYDDIEEKRLQNDVNPINTILSTTLHDGYDRTQATNYCEIIELDSVTEGAACTSLLAKKFIDNDQSLLIANSDQFIKWDSSTTMYSFISSGVDGGILTFKSTHPKWSFAKVNKNNFVEFVAEKNPISDNATVGVYFWKKGSDYVKYAEQMIKKDIRVNNEFYICPVFNEAIKDNKKIIIKEVDEMWGLGTPEDLDEFKKSNHYDLL